MAGYLWVGCGALATEAYVKTITGKYR